MRALGKLASLAFIVAAALICSVQTTDGAISGKPVRLWLDDLFFSHSESFFVRLQFKLSRERLALGGRSQKVQLRVCHAHTSPGLPITTQVKHLVASCHQRVLMSCTDGTYIGLCGINATELWCRCG
jgi:hypothetical protein